MGPILRKRHRFDPSSRISRPSTPLGPTSKTSTTLRMPFSTMAAPPAKQPTSQPDPKSTFLAGLDAVRRLFDVLLEPCDLFLKANRLRGTERQAAATSLRDFWCASSMASLEPQLRCSSAIDSIDSRHGLQAPETPAPQQRQRQRLHHRITASKS